MGEFVAVISSNIESLEWFDNGDLDVVFKRGGTYRYSAVPREVFEQVDNAESVGSEHASLIKGGGYAYRKLA